MTVLEVIQRSSQFLARKGVDSPRLQVELLLAHVLQMPRMKLYLDFDRSLSQDELETLRRLVTRRGAREPLQHIVESASFCGLDIRVTGDVLIPRPETELLAEQAWRCLATLGSRPSTVLDFGTGSGCVAIAIAVNCLSAAVHALDVSESALRIATENAARNGVATRITFHAGDGLDALPRDLRFDLIVSNPPYIPSAEIATLQPEVRDHDPVLALDGGADGLDFHRRLASGAGAFLAPAGRLLLELGDGQSRAVSELFTAQDWIVAAVLNDDSRRPRILIAHRND